MKPIWAMVEQANFASHLPEEFSELGNNCRQTSYNKEDD
jgi:hypothetical protein